MPRLFLALDPPSALRRELSRLGAELAGARPTRPEQVHLTLQFIGEVDETTADRLSEAAGRVRTAGFELTPRGVGVFPNRRRPRVAWVGLGDSPPLRALHLELNELLRSVDLRPAHQPFRPHLTVARFGRPDARSAGRWLTSHAGYAAPAFLVSAFGLWSSELRSSGAVHRLRRSFHLPGRNRS